MHLKGGDSHQLISLIGGSAAKRAYELHTVTEGEAACVLNELVDC